MKETINSDYIARAPGRSRIENREYATRNNAHQRDKRTKRGKSKRFKSKRANRLFVCFYRSVKPIDTSIGIESRGRISRGHKCGISHASALPVDRKELNRAASFVAPNTLLLLVINFHEQMRSILVDRCSRQGSASSSFKPR